MSNSQQWQREWGGVYVQYPLIERVCGWWDQLSHGIKRRIYFEWVLQPGVFEKDIHIGNDEGDLGSISPIGVYIVGGLLEEVVDGRTKFKYPETDETIIVRTKMKCWGKGL